MTLRLYNTLTRQKEDFSPLDPQNVRMYVCGPTVYDYAHIGNARPVIVFDVLFRLLKHLYEKNGGKVTYVRNITDIDDKINARAAEVAAAKGVSVEAARAEITALTAQQYVEDVTALGCLPPTDAPRATEYVKQMVAMIEKLVSSKNAYATTDGHVLFRVSSKADYGKLSRRPLDEMIAGARVEVATNKEDPMDFVLWKPSDGDTPGWDSPWGRGRPGWHIECSAMGEALLGETFDIHGGGIDLMFPHHENEIAQSESAHLGHPLAKVWMHNGFLQVEGEKMSKSLGNFVTIRELLRGWKERAWPGAAVRWAMLQTHYRQPIDWTEKLLAESAVELQEILNVLRGRHRTKPGNLVDLDVVLRLVDNPQPSPSVIAALEDDLNFAEATLAIRALKKEGSENSIEEAVRNMAFLGVFKRDDINFFGNYHAVGSDIEDRVDALRLATDYQTARANGDVSFEKSRLDEAHQKHWKFVERETFSIVVTNEGDLTSLEDVVQRLIDERSAAKKARDFKKADVIRDELLAKGIVLKDGPTGTTWEVKR